MEASHSYSNETVIEQLGEFTLPQPSPEEQSDVYYKIDPSADGASTIAGIAQTFETYDDLSGLNLIIEGDSQDLLTKDAFQDFLSGWGSGQGATLPGIPTSPLITLQCPICSRQVVTVRYDERDPIYCPVHPTTTLIFAS